jgi:hypothetical protein
MIWVGEDYCSGRGVEVQNNAIQLGVEVTGWEATPPASPVPRVNIAGAGIWPTTMEHLAWVGTWPTPDELVEKQMSVEVSVEVHTSVEELTWEHTTFKSLDIISH